MNTDKKTKGQLATMLLLAALGLTACKQNKPSKPAEVAATNWIRTMDGGTNYFTSSNVTDVAVVAFSDDEMRRLREFFFERVMESYHNANVDIYSNKNGVAGVFHIMELSGWLKAYNATFTINQTN